MYESGLLTLQHRNPDSGILFEQEGAHIAGELTDDIVLSAGDNVFFLNRLGSNMRQNHSIKQDPHFGKEVHEAGRWVSVCGTVAVYGSAVLPRGGLGTLRKRIRSNGVSRVVEFLFFVDIGAEMSESTPCDYVLLRVDLIGPRKLVKNPKVRFLLAYPVRESCAIILNGRFRVMRNKPKIKDLRVVKDVLFLVPVSPLVPMLQTRGRSRQVSNAALARQASEERLALARQASEERLAQQQQQPPILPILAPIPLKAACQPSFIRCFSPSPPSSASMSPDYYDLPASPLRSLEDQVHVAYALDDIHLAKILLLRLKGIEVTSDDDPRIAAVQDEDFDFCFVPNGRLMDESDEKAIKEMQTKELERLEERRRFENLRTCERIWDDHKRRMREERLAAFRQRERKWMEEEDRRRKSEQQQRRDEERHRAQKAAVAAEAQRAAQRTRARLVCYDNLPSNSEKRVSEQFVYDFMIPSTPSSPKPASPTISHSRPRLRGPIFDDSRSIPFTAVLDSMQGPLFPVSNEDLILRSHSPSTSSINPKFCFYIPHIVMAVFCWLISNHFLIIRRYRDPSNFTCTLFVFFQIHPHSRFTPVASSECPLPPNPPQTIKPSPMSYHGRRRSTSTVRAAKETGLVRRVSRFVELAKEFQQAYVNMALSTSIEPGKWEAGSGQTHILDPNSSMNVRGDRSPSSLSDERSGSGLDTIIASNSITLGASIPPSPNYIPLRSPFSPSDPPRTVLPDPLPYRLTFKPIPMPVRSPFRFHALSELHTIYPSISTDPSLLNSSSCCLFSHQGPVIWRIRSVSNPVYLRLKALHNVIWRSGMMWEGRGRDTALGGGRERIVGVAYDGVGRSSLSREVKD
ncbi:hypothetical protein BYT27DRAFT_7211658 [Phlegmacium glaucopus]|nr:hypothetical protein BYT27DRAFT_7211658 [Phlegmacium glaucopus]